MNKFEYHYSEFCLNQMIREQTETNATLISNEWENAEMEKIVCCNTRSNFVLYQPAVIFHL